MISLACHTLHSSIIGLHSFQLFSPIILGRWSGELHLVISWAITHLLYPWRDKSSCRDSNALCVRIWISQNCSLPTSLVSPCHHLGSADEQNCWLGLLLGCAGRNMFCQDPNAGCCKSSPFLLHNQISVGQDTQFPLQSLWGQPRVEVPKNNSQCWATRMPTLGSLFPLEEL